MVSHPSNSWASRLGLPQKTTMTGSYYGEVLTNLHQTVKKKWSIPLVWLVLTFHYFLLFGHWERKAPFSLGSKNMVGAELA